MKVAKAVAATAICALLLFAVLAVVGYVLLAKQRDAAFAARNAAEAERAMAAAAYEEAVEAEAQAKLAVKTALAAEKIAQTGRLNAEQEKARAEMESYASTLQLARMKLEQNYPGHAEELLDRLPVKLRHWEWHRVKREMDQSMVTLDSPSIGSVSYSPDGRLMATAKANVKIWNARTGKLIRSLVGNGSYSTRATFTPDSKGILINGSNGTVRLHSVADGKILQQIRECHRAVTYSTLSPDGRIAVTAGVDYGDKVDDAGRTIRTHAIKLWDLESGALVRTMAGHGSLINHVAMTADGKRLLSASNDRTARVWDVDSGKQLHVLRGQQGHFKAANFSPDGTRIIAGGERGLIRVWNAASGKVELSFEGHKDFVHSATFTPDGKGFVTGASDATLKLWDAERGVALKEFRGHKGYVATLAFSPDGRRMLAGDPFAAREWDLSGRDSEQVMAGLDLSFKHGELSSSGRYLVALASDRTARVWDLTSDTQVASLQASDAGGKYAVFESATFSPDETQVLTAGRGTSAHLWDIKTGKVICTFKTPSPFTNAACFSPDGKSVATISRDRHVRVWDMKTKQMKEWDSEHGAAISSISFSPKGRQIITTSGDKTAKIWDVDNAWLVTTLEGHESGVFHAAYSPDGKQIVTGGWRTARIWDAATGRRIAVMRGHRKFVRAVAFSSDGKRILTGSEDKLARLWDATTGREVLTVLENEAAVLSVAFSPNGVDLLVVGGHVRLLTIDPQ